MYADPSELHRAVDKRVSIPDLSTVPEHQRRDSAVQLLMQPNLRKHFMRVALSSAWAESIAESHRGAEDLDLVLENFAHEIAKISAVLSSVLSRAKSPFTLPEIIASLPPQSPAETLNVDKSHISYDKRSSLV